MISLTNVVKYVAREPAEDVVDKVVEFWRKLYSEIKVS